MNFERTFSNLNNIFYYPQKFDTKDGSKLFGDFTYFNLNYS